MKGLHARQDHERSRGVQGVSRRSIAKGAAWTAPILAVSVAAPSYAASGGCVEPGQALLMEGTSPVVLTFPSSSVTATVAYATTGYDGDATPGETGEVHATDYSPSWNYLKLHHPKGMDKNDTITLTLTLSQQVKNLTLTITDIDKTIGQWIDEIYLTSAFSVAMRGPNVTGNGTATDPFTTAVNGGITSARGDLQLTWAGPIQTVQITYRAADKDNKSDIGQHIGVGRIGFTC